MHHNMLFVGATGYLTDAAFLFVLLWTVQSGFTLEPHEDCVNPLGKSGKCILVRECEPLLALYRQDTNTPEETAFLFQSRCGTLNQKTLVCCVVSNNGSSSNQESPSYQRSSANEVSTPSSRYFPNQESSSLPVSPNCGIQLSDRVIGGQPTKIDEFPWMALIEYKKWDGSVGFHCGGALINNRYVVTAAHCIQLGKQQMRDWKVQRVRLGEWDLTSDHDCKDGICSDAPIDLDIEQIVVHSEYDSSSKANDIALIRFTRNVNSSNTVRPICLPLSQPLRERNHVGSSSYAAGWGKTESGSASEIKLKVELNVTSLQECAKIYKRSRTYLTPKQMCAGGVRGKDTCSGDSGGPLMRLMAGAWYMIGAVSFGALTCGTKGMPGVYTNVAEYVDWIQENIY